MGPFRAHGPSAGLAEANGLPEVHGLRGHSTPALPLSVALVIAQPIRKHVERRLRYSGNLGLSGRQ